MFVKNRLLKSINETYFRNYQDTKMTQLKEDYTTQIINNMKCLSQFRSRDSEEFNQLFDLKNIKLNSTSFMSVLGQESFLIQGKFQKSIENNLPNSEVYKEVVEILTSLSKNACVVGGFVRDSILGIKSKDLDLCTDTPYNCLKTAFKAKGFGIKEEGEAFLVMIISKNGEMYEIANFRMDSKESSDSRHPDSVKVGTLEEDSSRRDFCINSLYYRLSDGVLLDPTGIGIEDAINKQLRFVGNPKDRLKEDSLRLWRAFRLASTKNLKLERKTEKALRENFQWCYERSNPARVLQEMIKI